MAILSGDIALLASQIMDDVPEGGGRPTSSVIADGTSNGIFNDISEVDRAGGRVNMRKVFPAVQTLNTDGFYGANLIVAEIPVDPKVSITLFSTGNTFDTRSEAKGRVESYLAIGSSYPGYLFGNHISGQSMLSLLQGLDLPIPVMGDTIALRLREGSTNPVEQYVKALRVTSRTRTFEDEKGTYQRVEVIITLTDALTSDFKGFEATRSGPSAADFALGTKMYLTVVADASRYYGATTLKTAASVGDLAINVNSIFTQLVPSTRVEVPITDARITQRKSSLIKAGEPFTFSGNGQFNKSQALYVGGQILPGTLTFTSSGITLTDNAGLLYNGANSIGSIDYANGILRISTDIFGTSDITFNITYTPAAGPLAIGTSVGIPVSINNQRLSWTFSADSLPAKGSVQVSYRSYGQWYLLSDDGSGALRGTDSKFGAGSVNFITGSIQVTLGAIPDVGSQIIVQWVDTASTTTVSKQVATGNLPKAFGKVMQLDQAITPGSVLITWNDGKVHSATDNAGLLTGDATGEVNYSNGKITLRPNILPAQNTQINVSLSNGTSKSLSIVTFSDGGTGWKFDLVAPVKPCSLEIGTLGFYLTKDVNTLEPKAASGFYHITDDGAGNLIVANGTGSLIVGSIDYTTGKCLINKVTPGFACVVQTSKWTEVSPGVFGVSPTAPVSFTTDLNFTNTMLGNSSAPWSWNSSADALNVAIVRYVGADVGAKNVTFQFDSLFMMTATAPTAFNLGTKRYVQNSDTSYASDVSISTGVGTQSGILGVVSGYYGVILSKWLAGTTSVVSNLAGVVSQGVTALISNTTFRTAISPLFSGGFTISGVLQDGTQFNVVGDQDGNIINSSIGVYGRIDYVTGVCTLFFGDKVDDTQSGKPGVIDMSYVGLAGVKYLKVRSALADSLRYNSVGFSYLPVDQNILGLNPVRLPADGRVPIFRSGGFVVIGNTQTVPAARVSVNQVIDCGRVRLSRVRVIGADGLVINSGYAANLELGKVTFTDVTGYAQPVKIEHRIEDMALLSDVQIAGQLSFTRQLSHDYPIIGTTVSSALILSDLRARVSAVYDQSTWTNVWSDSLIGSDSVGTYNTVLSPIIVTNKGALTERWAIVFQTSTTFIVIGEHVGVIANGTINADCSPVNPAAGVPYFTIPALGWGQGWAVGNVLRFNTIGASPPIWVVRTILQGAPSASNDQFTLLIRGDVDNPN